MDLTLEVELNYLQNWPKIYINKPIPLSRKSLDPN